MISIVLVASTVAVLAIPPKPGATLLRSHLQSSVLASKDGYMHEKGFGVNGALHRMEVKSVDEESKRVEVIISLTYEFTNPALKWNSTAHGSISEMDLAPPFAPAIGGIRPHRIDGSSANRSSTVTSEGHVIITDDFYAKVHCAMNFDKKPDDTHDCELQLDIYNISAFDVTIDKGISVSGPEAWIVSSYLWSVSFKEHWDVMTNSFGRFARFEGSGGAGKTLNKVAIHFTFWRNVDLYNRTLDEINHAKRMSEGKNRTMNIPIASVSEIGTIVLTIILFVVLIIKKGFDLWKWKVEEERRRLRTIKEE